MYLAAVFTRVPDADVPEKYVIDLSVGQNDAGMSALVVAFNRASDKYRIRMTVWDQYDADRNYIGESMLESEIVSGRVPDIISTGSFKRSAEWTRSGAFADLNPLLEECGFDRSTVLDSVLKALEEDGKLYAFPIDFSIRTLAGNRSLIGADRWTTDEYIDAAESLPDGVYMSLFLSPEDTLSRLTTCSIGEFAGEKRFDGAEFRRILEYSASLSGNTTYTKTLNADERAELLDDMNKRPTATGSSFSRMSLCKASTECSG